MHNSAPVQVGKPLKDLTGVQPDDGFIESTAKLVHNVRKASSRHEFHKQVEFLLPIWLARQFMPQAENNVGRVKGLQDADFILQSFEAGPRWGGFHDEDMAVGFVHGQVDDAKGSIPNRIPLHPLHLIGRLGMHFCHFSSLNRAIDDSGLAGAYGEKFMISIWQYACRFQANFSQILCRERQSE